MKNKVSLLSSTQTPLEGYRSLTRGAVSPDLDFNKHVMSGDTIHTNKYSN